MASIHASEGTTTAMKGEVPSRRAVLHPAAQHLALAALRPGRLPKIKELHPGASERHSCPLRPRRLVRHHRDEQGRQSSAEWAARAVTDLCDKNPGLYDLLGCLRAHSDDDFRDTVTETAALHARDELFAKHLTPQTAEEGLLAWAKAEESDNDEDDAPMPDVPARPEPQLIACLQLQLPHLRCPTWSALRRTAPRTRRWTAMISSKKMPPASHLSEPVVGT